MKYLVYILIVITVFAVLFRCTKQYLVEDSPKEDIIHCSNIIFDGYRKDYVFKLLSGHWLLDDSTRLIIYSNGELYYLTYDKWIINKSFFNYGFHNNNLYLDANICNPMCGNVAYCDYLLINIDTDIRAVLITKDVE